MGTFDLKFGLHVVIFNKAGDKKKDNIQRRKVLRMKFVHQSRPE